MNFSTRISCWILIKIHYKEFLWIFQQEILVKFLNFKIFQQEILVEFLEKFSIRNFYEFFNKKFLLNFLILNKKFNIGLVEFNKNLLNSTRTLLKSTRPLLNFLLKNSKKFLKIQQEIQHGSCWIQQDLLNSTRTLLNFLLKN